MLGTERRSLVVFAVALPFAVACGDAKRVKGPPPLVVQAKATPTPLEAKAAAPAGPPLQVIDRANAHRLERLSLELDAVRDVRFVADGTLVVTWAHDVELVAPDGTTRARIPYAEPLAGMAWHDKPAWHASDPHEPNVEIAVLSQTGDRRSVVIYGTDGAEHARFDGAGVRVISHVSRARVAFGKDHSKVEVFDRASRARIAEIDVAGAHAWAKDGSRLAVDRMGGGVELIELGAPTASSGPAKSTFTWDDDRDLRGQTSADAVSMAPDGGSFAVVAGTKVTVIDVASKRRAVHSSARLFEDGGWDGTGKLALAVQNQLWLVDRANPKIVEKKTPPPIRCAQPCKPGNVGWEAIRWGEGGAPTLLGRLHPTTLVAWPVGGQARVASLDGDRLLSPQLFADTRYALRFDWGGWQIVRVAEDERTTTWPVLLAGHADRLTVSPRGSRLATRSLGGWHLYDVETKKEIARSTSAPIKTVKGTAQAPRFDFSDDILEILAQKELPDAIFPQHGLVARAGRYALRDDMYTNGGVDVIDLRSSELLWNGNDEASTVHDWAIDPSGERFAAVDYGTETRIKLWRKGQRKPVPFPMPIGSGYLAFAATHLVVATSNDTIGWDGKSESVSWVATCKAGRDVRLLVGDGGTRVTVGQGRTHCILDASTGKTVQRIELGEDAEHGPFLSSDGTELYVYAKARVRRWRMADGTELPSLSVTPSAGLVYGGSGTEVFALAREGFVFTFDRASGRELGRSPANGAIAFDVSKGALVVTLAADGTGVVCDREGKRLATFQCPKATSVWFASDDRAVACRRGKEHDVFVVTR